MSISCRLRPPSMSRPFPPLSETRSISRDIGSPSPTIEPATWTVAALLAAVLAAARISAGVFDATPLLEEAEEPQPASVAAASTDASASAGRDADRRRIAAQTVGRDPVG